MTDYRSLSDRELRQLQQDAEQAEHEPELRAEEKAAGSPDWDTVDYMTLLRRSIARFNEARRPDDLRKAHQLAIADPESLSTDALHWAVFDAETRERRIRELEARDRRANRRGLLSWR